MTSDLPAKATNNLTTHASPPHPLDGTWMMKVNDDIYGPYTGHDLKEFVAEGRLDAHGIVRRSNHGDYMAAYEDAALSHMFPDMKPSGRASGLPPLSADRGATVVQVNNTIQQPAYIAPGDIGADKSPGIALLLSLFFVGAGQLYNGDIGKGILMFFGCIFLWMVMLGWIINLWSMIDAYSKAKTLRTRHQMFMMNARQA